MRILAIGNIFESNSLNVDKFCEKDSEVIVKNISSRISGAVIVISAMAAFLHNDISMYSKFNHANNQFRELADLLVKFGVNTLMLKNCDSTNKLITIYDAEGSRKCYSSMNNSIVTNDLLALDYSAYDVVFFCCLPYSVVAPVFEKNQSLKDTTSIILASGLTKEYFDNACLLINPSIVFMNEGELNTVLGMACDSSKFIKKKMKSVNMRNTSLVVTRGARGVVTLGSWGYHNCSVSKVGSIIHPGGAGDSFALGFVHALFNNETIQNCCKLGHECALKMLSVYSVKEFLEREVKVNEEQKYC